MRNLVCMHIYNIYMCMYVYMRMLYMYIHAQHTHILTKLDFVQ